MPDFHDTHAVLCREKRTPSFRARGLLPFGRSNSWNGGSRGALVPHLRLPLLEEALDDDQVACLVHEHDRAHDHTVALSDVQRHPDEIHVALVQKLVHVEELLIDRDAAR